MLESYLGTPFQAAREVAVKKRSGSEKPEDFLWLDFLEEVVMSILSNEEETLSGRMTADELPTIRSIQWKNPRYLDIFNKLWDEFISATSESRAKIKLERMFLLYKNHGIPFDLRRDV